MKDINPNVGNFIQSHNHVLNDLKAAAKDEF
jgi:hypothetical protein